MRVIAEFFYRMMGPVFILGALATFSIWHSASSRHLANTKQRYTGDSVYEESSLAAEDESVVSKEELKAVLMVEPDRQIIIKDTVSGYTIKIHSGNTTDNFVSISGNGEQKEIFFGKGRWDATALDLDTWLQAKRFNSKPIVYTTGGIRRIYYKGTN